MIGKWASIEGGPARLIGALALSETADARIQHSVPCLALPVSPKFPQTGVHVAIRVSFPDSLMRWDFEVMGSSWLGSGPISARMIEIKTVQEIGRGSQQSVCERIEGRGEGWVPEEIFWLATRTPGCDSAARGGGTLRGRPVRTQGTEYLAVNRVTEDR